MSTWADHRQGDSSADPSPQARAAEAAAARQWHGAESGEPAQLTEEMRQGMLGQFEREMQQMSLGAQGFATQVDPAWDPMFQGVEGRRESPPQRRGAARTRRVDAENLPQRQDIPQTRRGDSESPPRRQEAGGARRGAPQASARKHVMLAAEVRNVRIALGRIEGMLLDEGSDGSDDSPRVLRAQRGARLGESATWGSPARSVGSGAMSPKGGTPQRVGGSRKGTPQAGRQRERSSRDNTPQGTPEGRAPSGRVARENTLHTTPEGRAPAERASRENTPQSILEGRASSGRSSKKGTSSRGSPLKSPIRPTSPPAGPPWKH